MNMNISAGAVGLLTNAKRRSFYKGEKYCFGGDLQQMSRACQVAIELGVATDIEGGIPFVMSREDYEKVTQHIISHKIEGWWHYVSREEYLELKDK